MKNVRKRALAWVLTVLMILSVMPVGVFAEGYDPDDYSDNYGYSDYDADYSDYEDEEEDEEEEYEEDEEEVAVAVAAPMFSFGVTPEAAASGRYLYVSGRTDDEQGIGIDGAILFAWDEVVVTGRHMAGHPTTGREGRMQMDNLMPWATSLNSPAQSDQFTHNAGDVNFTIQATMDRTGGGVLINTVSWGDAVAGSLPSHMSFAIDGITITRWDEVVWDLATFLDNPAVTGLNDINGLVASGSTITIEGGGITPTDELARVTLTADWGGARIPLDGINNAEIQTIAFDFRNAIGRDQVLVQSFDPTPPEPGIFVDIDTEDAAAGVWTTVIIPVSAPLAADVTHLQVVPLQDRASGDVFDIRNITLTVSGEPAYISPDAVTGAGAEIGILPADAPPFTPPIPIYGEFARFTLTESWGAARIELDGINPQNIENVRFEYRNVSDYAQVAVQSFPGFGNIGFPSAPTGVWTTVSIPITTALGAEITQIQIAPNPDRDEGAIFDIRNVVLTVSGAATDIPLSSVTASGASRTVMTDGGLIGPRQTISRAGRNVIVDGLGTTLRVVVSTLGIGTGYVYVYNLLGERAGIHILDPEIDAVEAGDRIIVVGRTTEASGNLEIVNGNNPLTAPHKTVAAPAGPFSMELEITSIMQITGLALLVRDTLPRPDGFMFSIDDVIVYRPGTGPVFTGDRAEVDRDAVGDGIVFGGGGMAALIEADSFDAVGGADFTAEDNYVFVENIANNSSGIIVLPAAAFNPQPGYQYTLRARGRTTGTVANSRLELAPITAGAGAGLGNEAVTPGSPHSIPTSFYFDFDLNAAQIASGLRIAPNGWSWGTENWEDRFTNFAFTIDDVIVFRTEIITSYQVINFNLATEDDFQDLTAGETISGHGEELGTERLTTSGGTVNVLIGAQGGRNFFYVGSRHNNWDGINILGATNGQSIRVTGRTGANWVQGDGTMQLAGSNVVDLGNLAAGATFTLYGVVTNAGGLRIQSNAWETATAATQSFYIHSIIVGTDLFEEAQDPDDTVDVAATENFRPPAIPRERTWNASVADSHYGTLAQTTGSAAIDSNVTLTLNERVGFTLSAILISGVDAISQDLAARSITFTMPAGTTPLDVVVTPTWAEIPRAWTATLAGNIGALATGSAEGTAITGETVTLTIAELSGFNLTGLSLVGMPGGFTGTPNVAQRQISFEMPEGTDAVSVTVTPTWTRNWTAEVAGYGELVTGTGATAVGSAVVLTLQARPGHHLTNLSVSGEGVVQSTAPDLLGRIVEFNMPLGDGPLAVTVTPTWEEIPPEARAWTAEVVGIGTLTATYGSALPNANVTLTLNARTGYALSGISVAGIGITQSSYDLALRQITFVMPEGAGTLEVTVTPTWVPVTRVWTATLAGNIGELATSSTAGTAIAGETVTLTIAELSGFNLTGLSLLGMPGGFTGTPNVQARQISFVMPEGTDAVSVTVTPTWTRNWTAEVAGYGELVAGTGATAVGSAVVLTLQARPGHQLTNLSVSGEGVVQSTAPDLLGRIVEFNMPLGDGPLAVTVTPTWELVPVGPVIPGARGTLASRTTVDEIVIGQDFLALMAANHFVSVGTADFVPRANYVVAFDIVGNAAGMQILPAGLTELRPGDVIHATGRTSNTTDLASSRLSLTYIDSPAGHSFADDAVHPGSPFSIPAGGFTFTHTLTAGNIERGLRIAPNVWNPGVRPDDFGFSIDDLFVERGELGYQEILFNLATDTGFQGLAEGQTFQGHEVSIGTPRLVTNGSANFLVTIGRHANRNYMHVGNRELNSDGINIAGALVGQEVRVTGRTGATWPATNSAMELSDISGRSQVIISEPNARFTLSGTVTGDSVRITGNAFNEAHPASLMDFYIYSIIVGYYLDQPAENPENTVDIDEIEDFWPGEVVILEGWQLIDGIWFFYIEGTRVIGWHYMDGAWFYFLPEENGAVATGAHKIDGVWQYFHPNGAWSHYIDVDIEGWQLIDDIWFFYIAGIRVIGWHYMDGAWFYFLPEQNGAVATGAHKIDGVWQYFHPNGAWSHYIVDDLEGWQLIDGIWFFYIEGTRVIGWHFMDGAWFYFLPEQNGAVAIGAHQIGGVWQYFHPNGAWSHYIVDNLEGWQEIGGQWFFYIEGTRVIGWHFMDGNWFYFLPEQNGAAAIGAHQINGVWQYFHPNGAWSHYIDDLPDGWQLIDGTWFFYIEGTRVIGWHFMDGNWFYFLPEQNGAVATGAHQIGGVWQYFHPNGAWSHYIDDLPDGWQLIDGTWFFYIGGNRHMGWHFMDGNWFYFLPEQNGAVAIGAHQINGVWQYFHPNGAWSHYIV